jgi:hypothetical protein
MSTYGAKKFSCIALRNAKAWTGKPPDWRPGRVPADIELCSSACTPMPARPVFAGTKGSFGHFGWQQAGDHGIQLFLRTFEPARPFAMI